MGLYSGKPNVNTWLGLANKVHTFFKNLRTNHITANAPYRWKSEQAGPEGALHPTKFKLVKKLKK